MPIVLQVANGWVQTKGGLLPHKAQAEGISSGSKRGEEASSRENQPACIAEDATSEIEGQSMYAKEMVTASREWQYTSLEDSSVRTYQR